MKRLQIIMKNIRKNEKVLRKIRQKNKVLHDKLYAEQRKEVAEIVENLLRSGKILKNCSHPKLKSWKCKEERICRGHLMCNKCGEKRIQFAYELPLIRSEMDLIFSKTRKLNRKYGVYANRRGAILDDVPTRARF